MVRVNRRSRHLSFLAIVPATFLIYGCGTKATWDQKSIPKVTIGIQVSPAMTLLMVAKDKGFFQEEGADVELKEFTAGKFALQAFLGGSIDFAVSGEVPVALATLQGNPTKVVAQVVEKTTNEVRVVARRENGVTDPTAYFKRKKRKLATSFGGGPEFYTYSFLRHYAIPPKQVEVLSQKPEDMPAALETRSVDAIAVFDPFAFLAEQRLGAAGITFTDSQLYSELYVLNAKADQLEAKPAIIEGMLRALDKAANFVASDPATSKSILLKYTHLNPEVVDGIWKNFSFRPALTQQLIDVWDAEAKWARDTGKIGPNVDLPNFRKIVDDRFLRKVKPESVTLRSEP